MPNAFLLMRFVFLSILLYISLFVLCFAGWNVAALGAVGMSIPSALYLTFLCMSFTLTFGALSFAEMYCGITLFSKVRYECAWTGLMTLLQLAMVILYAFVQPSAKCNGNWNVCSSSSVLQPFMCLSFVMMLTYFTALTATASAHSSKLPEVWGMSIYAVRWFPTIAHGQPTMPIVTTSRTVYTHQHSASTPLTTREKDTWSAYLDNIGQTPAPVWGKQRAPVSIWNSKRDQVISDIEKAPRRAVDPAFPTFRSLDNLRAPPRPARLREAVSEGSISSRFIERIRESRYAPRAQARMSGDSSDSLTPFNTSHHNASDDRASISSGSTTDVEDYIIPCPRLSSWVTADTHRNLSDDGFSSD